MAMGNEERPRLSAQAQETEIDGLLETYNAWSVIIEGLSAFGHGVITKDEAIKRNIFNKEILMARIKHQKAVALDTTEDWQSHPPKRPGMYELAFYRDDKLHSYFNFGKPFAALKFFELVVGDKKYKQLNNTKLHVPYYELDVVSTYLEDILEHEYTPKEKAFELPAPYPNLVKSIRTGRKQKIATPEQRVDPSLVKALKKLPALKGEGTTIQELCAQLKLEPRVARGILRKHKIEKPYAWKDPSPIIKLLKGK